MFEHFQVMQWASKSSDNLVLLPRQQVELHRAVELRRAPPSAAGDRPIGSTGAGGGGRSLNPGSVESSGGPAQSASDISFGGSAGAASIFGLQETELT